jgi:hypothetical protein
MQPERSGSFLSSIEGAHEARTAPGVRLVLAAWAALVYLVYWLGYLGLR